MNKHTHDKFGGTLGCGGCYSQLQCCLLCSKVKVTDKNIFDYVACKNKSCSCHPQPKPEPEAWETKIEDEDIGCCYANSLCDVYQTTGLDHNDVIKSFIRNLLSQKEQEVRRELVEKSCPPHNLIDYDYSGAWAGSTPPPNKMCSKCLVTMRL